LFGVETNGEPLALDHTEPEVPAAEALKMREQAG
jgi:hypothetical protein